MHVAWQDTRNGARDILYNRSLDGGATWQVADARLDTDIAGANASVTVRLCCNGMNVYAVWEDSRNGNSDIFLNSSNDAGVTWQIADIRKDTDAPGVGDSTVPQLCCEGVNVHIVWEDTRNGATDIFTNFQAP